MSARRQATRSTAVAIGATLLLTFGLAGAGHAGQTDPRPEDSVEAALLDIAQMVYPTPEGMDYYWSSKERFEGFLGINDFPGGPVGAFPQPANPNDPKHMPGGPGYGVQGIVADATGVNPRPPGTDVGQDRPSRTQLGPVLLPICDSPKPCDLTPLVDEREPKPFDAAELVADRQAGLERAVAEATLSGGGKSVVASLDDELPDVSKAPIDDPAQLMSDVTTMAELAAGYVLEEVAPEQEGDNEELTAPAGEDNVTEIPTPAAPAKKKGHGKR